MLPKGRDIFNAILARSAHLNFLSVSSDLSHWCWAVRFPFVKFHSSLFPNGCLNSWYLRRMTDTNTAEKLLLINCSALADIAWRRASRLCIMDIFWKGNLRYCNSHFVISVERIPEGPFTRKKVSFLWPSNRRTPVRETKGAGSHRAVYHAWGKTILLLSRDGFTFYFRASEWTRNMHFLW